MKEKATTTAKPDDSVKSLAADKQCRCKESMVEKQRDPGKQACSDGLCEACAGDTSNKAATFQEREDWIDLEGEAGGQDDADPGKTPGDWVDCVWRGRKEMPSDRDEKAGHEHGCGAVPFDGLAEDGGEARVRGLGPEDAVGGIDGEVSNFVGSKLEDDDGEAKLEDDLERDERAEGVVVALFGGRELARD